MFRLLFLSLLVWVNVVFGCLVLEASEDAG